MKHPKLIPPNINTRVLLVFPKNDGVCGTLNDACNRLEMDTFQSQTVNDTIDLFQNCTTGGHNLIIVDGRTPSILEPETIARAIKTSNGGQYATLIVVLKKEAFDSDDAATLSLLDAGYSRCMIESYSISVCISKLREIQFSLVRPQSIIATQQVLYTFLYRNKEATVITDDLLRIQYVNESAERLFDAKIEEILSRPLADIFLSDIRPIRTMANTNDEFDVQVSVKRKSGGALNVDCHFIPIICIGRRTTHFLITFDSNLAVTNNNNNITNNNSISTPNDVININEPIYPNQQTITVQNTVPKMTHSHSEPRGSIFSLRRGSFDVRSIASENIRRTSLAKLSSLPLEAPITKVVSMLSQVQESCSPDEAKLLDKVMEFLKREGLYSPQMKDMRTEDPVATDLIGALLTQGPSNTISSRRSSNDSVVRSTPNRQTSILLSSKSKGSSIINNLLQSCLEWNFDIFRLEQISDKHPLVYLGMELFQRFEVFAALNIDETTCKSWLSVVEAHYHSTNTYHNSTHAADVMQATGVFLYELQKKDSQLMDRIDEATALISAAAHDIDHPGRSSAFLCNANNLLAILYNDICVLESHHAALMFKLTLRDDKINIFKNLDRETYKSMRSIIVDMILATEMTKHFEHLAKFVSVFGNDNENEILVDCDDNHMLIRRMLIKCADVSNPARPFSYCVEWAGRIAEEYFKQTDEEKRLSLPIVMPMFDRETCSIAKSQIGFIEFIIQDMMKAWDGFIKMPQLITCMEYNYVQWKKFEERGIHTLNDIKKEKMSLLLDQNNHLTNSS